tara:strand:- start:244 stop:2340 length:2097 start_codon:yes stop_codon:yes gene_type:complete
MKKKILVRAPALSRSGYGEQARFALRALRKYEDIFDIYLYPITWGKTSWIWEENEEREWLDRLIEKTFQHQQKNGTYDISLQVTIPNEWEKMAPVNIGYTAGIETNKIAGPWIEKCNIMDHIIVVSEHAKHGFENTSYEVVDRNTGKKIPDFRCTTPVTTVSYATRDIEPIDPQLDLKTDFNFLTIAQWSPRKNLENTIKWFIEEFKNEEVGLIVKANLANNSNRDRQVTKRRLRSFINKHPDRKCKIYLLHGDMTEEELTGLYRHPKVKALINLAHGEGFGLPMFEAIQNELPVIAPGWSGHVDFLYAPKKDKKTKKVRNRPHFSKVDYTLQPVQKAAVWEDVLVADSMWCFPNKGSYKKELRNVYKNYGYYLSLTKKLKQHNEEKFSQESTYRQFAEIAYGEKIIKSEDVKYVFVNDLWPEQYLGGAELTLDALLEKKFDECIKVNSKSLTRELIDTHKDKTWVFGNFTQMPDWSAAYLQDNGVSYNIVEFDYKYCKYRNLELHELMEGKSCSCQDSEFGKAVKGFFDNASHVFFMSDKQMTIIRERLSLGKQKCSVLSSVFKKEHLDYIKQLRESGPENRENVWAISASPNWVKGHGEAKTWCKEKNEDFVELNNMPYEKVLETLSKVKGLCLLPPGADTCPRLVIEAKLLGCQLNCNENVQHLEEGWFNDQSPGQIENYLKNYDKRFWGVLNVQ